VTVVGRDVAIVGYGPVGAALAIQLAQRGRSVVILERWPEPYPLPRAVHFDHEAARILQSCGLGADLEKIGEPAEVYEWRNASGQTLLRFGRVGLGLSGWPESSMFTQPALEACLEQRVDELDLIEVRRGAAVEGLVDTGDHVTVTGPGFDVSARYAIGCDGANSTVRGLMEVPVVDLGFFYDWLIVDVVLHEPREFDPINLQICDPARPTTAVSGGPGRRRWEFMRLPHERLDDMNDERVAWELLAPWDVHPGNAALERHAVYTFNARYAEDWRRGRVLLAGDAAHLMPPFAGQGLCSGLRDAANLGWKLDLVLSGAAPDALLDSYTEERMHHARAVIDFSIELGKVICVPNPAEAAVRDEAMVASLTGELAEIPPLPPLDGGLFHSTDPHAGRLFPQGVVEMGGRRDRLDQLVAPGWRLLTVDPAGLDADPWFEGIGGSVIRIGPREDAVDVVDVDGTYTRWFESSRVTWALERPDFHVFGTAGSAGDAAALLTVLRDQLALAPASS
jgi:2-polyprenyl-6-methoxyphenol hydroxylase-like FAD-dependent oxidoreductase